MAIKFQGNSLVLDRDGRHEIYFFQKVGEIVRPWRMK